MKVFDLITFSGEYDLLEVRFNILRDVVDKFIICEMPETFSGLPKPLYWIERDRDRFEEWEHKVIHLTATYGEDQMIMEMMRDRPYVDQLPFRKAFYQKEFLRTALKDAEDDDVIIYGDADEIINPERVKDAQDQPYKLRQLAYSYFLNNRSEEDWRGTVMTTYRTLKSRCLNDLRAYPEKIMEDGGWHWTNLGGLEAIRQKIASYDHQEVNVPFVTEGLAERMRLNVDFLGRGYNMWVSEDGLPDYILKNKARYDHLWKF